MLPGEHDALGRATGLGVNIAAMGAMQTFCLGESLEFGFRLGGNDQSECAVGSEELGGSGYEVAERQRIVMAGCAACGIGVLEAVGEVGRIGDDESVVCVVFVGSVVSVVFVGSAGSTARVSFLTASRWVYAPKALTSAFAI